MRKGFTLIEFLIAILLFGFMAMSLATIYSTAHKHMFQNYRQNTVKANASVAMKTITSRLQQGNRIDLPLPGESGNILAFAVNVDQVSGCYPVNPDTPSMTAWHYFCYLPGVTAQCPLGNCLFYHTGPIAGGAGCPSGTVWNTANGYPVAGNCGRITRPGEAVPLLLSSFVSPAPSLFSRPNGGAGTLGNSVVNINLRVYWDPWAQAVPGVKDFRSTARLIDVTLNTNVRVVRSGR